MKKMIVIGLGISLLASTSLQANVTSECRGIALGIVSSMKVNDEVKGQEAIQAAILAARRACSAVLENYSDDELAEISSDEKSVAKKEDADEAEVKKITTWEILTQDQEEKAGNKRLKRLRN